MKRVSLIIPVYNGEKHIGECIENLLMQTYRNIEIIVINDGSQDKTKEVIEMYAKQDDRIVVVNKKNEGVSKARNEGILRATGEYIMFVDSDDTIVDNAIEILLEQNDNNDLIIFGFKVEGSKNRKNDTEVLKKIQQNNELKTREKVLQAVISTKNNIFGYIWRAIYSKSLLINNEIFFPNGIKISEDYLFLLDAIRNANSIKIISDELYVYKIGESSMSIKYIPTLLNDMEYVNEWMYNSIVKHNKVFQLGYYCSVANTYLRFLQNTFRKTDNFNKKHKEVKLEKYKYKEAINKTWYRIDKFPIKSYIAMFLFEFNLEIIYEFLFNLKQKKKEKRL